MLFLFFSVLMWLKYESRFSCPHVTGIDGDHAADTIVKNLGIIHSCLGT